jgi:restriction endonuclease S subunit
MIKKYLDDLVQIHGGISFQPPEKASDSIEIYLLQPKDVVIGKSLHDLENVMRVPFYGRIVDRLQRGDVVLVSRCTESGYFRSALYEGGDEPVVTGSSLLVLRLRSGDIIPEYLVSYLNSAIGQNELHKLASGATIKFLPRAQLKSLLIPILPKEEQKAFVELEQNIRQQINLLNKQKDILSNLLVGASQSLLSPNI